jgi:uncharacterized membrane protein YdcZ (DUF606 family)
MPRRAALLVTLAGTAGFGTALPVAGQTPRPGLQSPSSTLPTWRPFGGVGGAAGLATSTTGLPSAWLWA